MTRNGTTRLALALAALLGLGGLVVAPAAQAALPTTSQPVLHLDRTIRTSPFAGSTTTVRDNEGNAYVAADNSFWIVSDNDDAAFELDASTGALKRKISQSAFAAAPRLGVGTLAGTSRNEDLEAIAYDAANDLLYMFSGVTGSTPTVYRLTRDGSGVFQVTSWQPLASEFTAAAWRPSDGKVYVGVSGTLRSYDYVSNTLGSSFSISGVSNLFGMDFTDDGNDLLTVNGAKQLQRIDFVARALRPGWTLDLTPFGILDSRAVELVGSQLFVSDGYDYRASGDPLSHAVFVLSVTDGATPSAPTAGFTAVPTSGTAPLTVAFTDTSTGGPTSWSWAFGDGGTSTARNPSHIYTSTGTYTVTLTATNAQGSSQETASVVVTTGGGGSQVTVLPAGDTYANTESPAKNYGSYTVLKLHSPTAEYRPYVQFSVNGLVTAPSSVKLRLYVTDASPAAGSWYRISDGWTEGTLVWNNAPALTGSPVGNAGAAVLNTWVEVDVTAVVTGNGTYSFGASSPSTNTAQFSTKEGANAPQLVITP
jgi:PKD repeat protein